MNPDPNEIMFASLTLFVAIVLLPALRSPALDWPQWRGPNRDGISLEAGWSTNWPKEGLKELWKAEIGTGYGSVAVSQGRLFVMGNAAEQDTVYCLDASTGKQSCFLDDFSGISSMGCGACPPRDRAS